MASVPHARLEELLSEKKLQLVEFHHTGPGELGSKIQAIKLVFHSNEAGSERDQLVGGILKQFGFHAVVPMKPAEHFENPKDKEMELRLTYEIQNADQAAYYALLSFVRRIQRRQEITEFRIPEGKDSMSASA